MIDREVSTLAGSGAPNSAAVLLLAAAACARATPLPPPLPRESRTVIVLGFEGSRAATSTPIRLQRFMRSRAAASRPRAG